MITLIAGGVGAARLLRGLARVVPHERLTVVVNTGDDDTFYGLHVSPDIDTIIYTMAGLAPIDRGWGIENDTSRVREALERLAGPGWFALGDRDMATHIYRTWRLSAGATLSEVTREIATAHGVGLRVLPMSDQPVRTIIDSDRGELAFQEYLVRLRGRPRVQAVRYRGARSAKPAAGVLRAIERSTRIIIAPSNPFVSVGPILSVPGIRRALAAARERVVAVSPLIGGRAVKGPLAAMLRSLGHKAEVTAIAELYRGLASRLVVAPGDRPRHSAPPGMQIVEHDILILEPRRAEQLARFLCEGIWPRRGAKARAAKPPVGKAAGSATSPRTSARRKRP
ncbi:MAG TPA: 2-phospho-L-lactate transferase [Candidatus Limnocylindrales bacterium]|nr:2-phospho-L-lactate transferase [Candidatus Limnocylindrales bacterium]